MENAWAQFVLWVLYFAPLLIALLGFWGALLRFLGAWLSKRAIDRAIDHQLKQLERDRK